MRGKLREKESARWSGRFLFYDDSTIAVRTILQVGYDVRENVADGRAKDGENDDNDNGDQDQDQSVLDKSLTFFTRLVQHR